MTALSRVERVAAGVAVAALAAFVGVGALALLVGIPVASTSGGPGMTGGPGMMGGPGGFPFVLFPFTFLTFAALFVLGSVGIRALTGTEETDRADDETVDPVTRIKRRYTDGELTEAEFERALERELADGESDRDVGDRPELEAANAERSVSGRERQ